jgi:spore coat polysaccharide biosynthesis predicted glycosyltransferase SpsG
MEVTRGPVLFRTDATPEHGFEAFYQSLTLAAAMQRRRRGTHFLSYLEPLSLAQVINRGNNDWQPAESCIGGPGDLEATLREIRRLNAAAVILAGRNITAEYIEAINRMGVRTLVIDSEPHFSNPAKIVVNPYLAPGSRAYKVEPGSQLLLGRKFALVRGVFRRQRTIRATEQPAPYRVLVAFGDDDFGDQTLLRTEQLLEMPKVDKVSIATRTHHPRYHELKDYAENSGGRVEVVTEPKELMTRLVRSHVALTAGETWSTELCCVGIPQLLLPTQTTHLMNAKRLDDEGAATLLGAAQDVSFDTLYEAVNMVLDDPMERLGMNRCGRSLIDGRGGDRIVNGLEIVLHAPQRGEETRLRIAA